MNAYGGMPTDVPIKRSECLQEVLNAEMDPNDWWNIEFMNRRKARDLETVQVLLHLEGMETNVVLLRKEQHRCNNFNRIPFHNEILEHWQKFARVQANNELEVFEIADITLPPAPFFQNHIVPILQNDSLLRLDLINCGLESSEIRGIAEILKNCPTLTSLCLAQVKIVDIEDAKCLSSAMAKHIELFIVDLSQCGLGESDDILSTILKGCKKLNSLDLRRNGFSSTSLALIAKFVSTHKSLTSLNVGEEEGNKMEMDDKSVQLLSTAVEKNKTLEQICLACTNITLSTKAQRNLVLNNKLLHVDLSWSDLRSNGAKYIVKHVKRDPPLAMLNLRGCTLPNRSAEGLCNALKRNTNLAYLDIRDNNFNDGSVPFFVDMLRKNSTLLTLDMAGNKMKIKSGRKDLINLALCDSSSLQAITESNHTCLVTLNKGTVGEKDTHEGKFRNINALENEGQKIRYKVVAVLFTLKTIAFPPPDFQNLPLELMPRLLELVQLEMGYGGYGRGVWKAPIRRKGSNPRLARVYRVIHSWSMMPTLFAVSLSFLILLQMIASLIYVFTPNELAFLLVTARTRKDQEKE